MKILTEKERLKVAKTLACMAHAQQKDKVGEPYKGHLNRVVNRCKSVPAKIVAWLHDIVEDKHLSHDDLESMGVFTGHELYCLRLLDKNFRGELALDHLINYKEPDGYLKNIKSVPLAREVKIADLKDNMDTNRFLRNGIELTAKDRERLKKYADQLAYLQE